MPDRTNSARQEQKPYVIYISADGFRYDLADKYTRLQVVKGWLTLPEARRPHLILFYLSQVDHAEHLYGPDSKETEAAVHLVDDCIGKMIAICQKD